MTQNQKDKFADNARKGFYFFQPDGKLRPTPRTYRESLMGQKQFDDRRQEKLKGDIK
jgi:hypothetical protein